MVAVSVTFVPQLDGSILAVPDAPYPSQASSRSGSLVLTFTDSPIASRSRSPSSSAHSSGGDFTSVRDTS